MLCFIIEHKKAYKAFTSNADNGLRDFELKTDEWKIIEDLCTILEVRLCILWIAYLILTYTSALNLHIIF
jgi:hypothetical protein